MHCAGSSSCDSLLVAWHWRAYSAQAQTPPAPPPGSQVPVGNSVITYIEVAPGSETKALAALKALKTASAKDDGFVSLTCAPAHHGHPNHFALIETLEGQRGAGGASDAAACEDGARRAARRSKPRPMTSDRIKRSRDRAGNKAGGGTRSIRSLMSISCRLSASRAKRCCRHFAVEGRRSDGNARFDVLTQASRPNHMTIVAVWNNLGCVEAPHRRGGDQGIPRGVAAEKRQPLRRAALSRGELDAIRRHVARPRVTLWIRLRMSGFERLRYAHL